MIPSTPRRLPEACKAFLSRGVALVVAGTTLWAVPCATSAQELGPGAMPMGVRMDVISDVYPIAGTTAREILDQMRALGPGSGWIRTPYRYSWTYVNERVPLASGIPSTSCRPISSADLPSSQALSRYLFII